MCLCKGVLRIHTSWWEGLSNRRKMGLPWCMCACGPQNTPSSATKSHTVFTAEQTHTHRHRHTQTPPKHTHTVIMALNNHVDTRSWPYVCASSWTKTTHTHKLTLLTDDNVSDWLALSVQCVLLDLNKDSHTALRCSWTTDHLLQKNWQSELCLFMSFRVQMWKSSPEKVFTAGASEPLILLHCEPLLPPTLMKQTGWAMRNP